MKKLRILSSELLKGWDTEDLIEALTAAEEYSTEPIIGTGEMWAERADAYRAELIRRNARVRLTR
jgi:hypothetical protein